jgi:sugar-specific transcriptional regulator TrmB
MKDAVFHGQKTIDRSKEPLPPLWVHPPSFGRNAPRIRRRSESRVWLIDPDGLVRSKLVEIVDGANQIVCVCSFLIADKNIVDALLRAHERGVRVYLLTASENQLLKEPRTDSEFDAERLKDHIETLRLMAGRVLVRTGEHFHSKFVLADPNSRNARGFLSTANLTSEALTRNVELAVELTVLEVRDLFEQFLIGFWKESSSELLEKGGLSRVEPTPDLGVENPREVLCTTREIHTLRSTADRLIEEAKSEIVVSSFGFDLQHETVQRLAAAAAAGKVVRVFARPRPNKTTMDALVALRKAGADVRGHPWLHAKCLVVNTERGWTGLMMTANLEKRGLDEGFETGALLDAKDAETLHEYAGSWQESFPLELLVDRRIGDVDGEATIWRDGELRKISVRKKGETDLHEFRVKKVEEMEGFEPDFSKVAERGDEIYQEHTFVWTVLAPKPEVAKSQKT